MCSSPAVCCGRALAVRPRCAGSWGYHGHHAPHGDRLLSLRRRVPVLTVVVDTPARIRRWFEIVDELTDETGLVTCEGDLRLSTLSAGEGA
jgi:PII-like signaling protein